MPISIAKSCGSCQFYQSLTRTSGSCDQHYDLRVKDKWVCEKFERFILHRDLVPQIPQNIQSDPVLAGWRQKCQRERKMARYLAESKIVYTHQEAAKAAFLALNSQNTKGWSLKQRNEYYEACKSKPPDLQKQLRTIIKNWRRRFQDNNPQPSKIDTEPKALNRFTEMLDEGD